MADVASGIPHWLQMVWAISGSTALILAVFWTLFIFYPYLRRMERKQDEALKIGHATAKILDDLEAKLLPIIDKLSETVNQLPGIMGDVGKVIGEVRGAVEQFTKQGDVAKVAKILGKLETVMSDVSKVAEKGPVNGVSNVLKSILDIRDALVGDFDGLEKRGTKVG
jgi:hypothetical protein